MHGLTDAARMVKIFGERNTGTNAFAKLLRRNSASGVLPSQKGELPGAIALIGRAFARYAPAKTGERIIDLVFAQAATSDAWKHRATYFSDTELARLASFPTFIMIRHPASWLVGLQRRPYHALQPVPAGLPEFLATDWQTAGREGLGRKSYRPAELYNEKLRSYLWFEGEMQKRGGKVEFVRFEDFVIDQAGVFNHVAAHLDEPSPEPRIIASSTKKSGKSAGDYAKYYRDQVWAGDIDAAARDIILSEIDWTTVSRFYDETDWRQSTAS